MSFRYAHGNVQLLHVIYLWTCHLIIQQNRFKTLNTYSLQQSPSWEANQFSASQEIPRILWNPKVHYRIHKCPPPVPILSQFEPVHTPTSYFLKIHFNIILPPTPGSRKWSLSLTFPHQNPVYVHPLPHTRHMPRPSHSSRFYHPDSIGWGVQIIQLITNYIEQNPSLRADKSLYNKQIPSIL